MIGYIITGMVCGLIGIFMTAIVCAGGDKEGEAYRRGLRDGANETRKMIDGDRRLP